MNARAVVRATLLDNLLKLYSGTPLLTDDERLWFAYQRLTGFDAVLFGRVKEEDLALANACLVLEDELRDEAIGTLERLLALVGDDEGRTSPSPWRRSRSHRSTFTNRARWPPGSRQRSSSSSVKEDRVGGNWTAPIPHSS
jgi:hypothetical protein